MNNNQTHKYNNNNHLIQTYNKIVNPQSNFKHKHNNKYNKLQIQNKVLNELKYYII